MVRGPEGPGGSGGVALGASATPMVQGNNLARTGPDAAGPALGGTALVLLGISCLTISEGERRARLFASLRHPAR